MTDDDRTCRVFALAGLVSGVWNGLDAALEKGRITEMIKQLGGNINESDEWVPGTTHVINLMPEAYVGMSEKTMAGIAAGQWVLTKEYVEESFKSHKWLNNERDHLSPPEGQVFIRRFHRRVLGEEGLIFHSMVAVVIMMNKRKAGVFERIIGAGGGKVRKAAGLPELAANYSDDITHVFMEPWVGGEDPPGLRDLEAAGESTGLHVCDYKFIFQKVKGEETDEDDWKIRGPRAKLNAENLEGASKPKRLRMMGPSDLQDSPDPVPNEEPQEPGPMPTTSQNASRAQDDGPAPNIKKTGSTGAVPKLPSPPRAEEAMRVTTGAPEAPEAPEAPKNHLAVENSPSQPAQNGTNGTTENEDSDAGEDDLPIPLPERPTSPLTSSPGAARNVDSPPGTEPGSSTGQEEEICVICQETIDSQDRCVLGCLHSIHVECAENWLRVSPSCPTCRERCNHDNPALLPPGEHQSVAFMNGAILTNRLQPDGRPPVRITVERVPSNSIGRGRFGRWNPGTRRLDATAPATEEQRANNRAAAARSCSSAQLTRRNRSASRALAGRSRTPRVRPSSGTRRTSARGTSASRQRRANEQPTTRRAPSGRDRAGGEPALSQMTPVGTYGSRSVSRQRRQNPGGSRAPDGPWRRPIEAVGPEAAPMVFERTGMEEAIRRAFVDGFTFGSATIGMSPQERIDRYNREEARTVGARDHSSRRSEMALERFSGLATNAMYLVVICLMFLLVPRANAGMIEPAQASGHHDPKVITSYRAGDVLAFENNPRAVSLAMTSETVDVSILFKLKEQLEKLVQHAGALGSNNLVARSACEHFCQPMGYATKLTQVLDPTLRTPHYVYTKESHNRPEKTYFVMLLTNGQGGRECNYSLSHSATFSLTSALDLGSPYYTESRSEKYQIYALWLVDMRGEPCKDGVNVKRGEIVPKDADFEVTVMHSHGSLWGCMEVCNNINGLRETALKFPGCVLGQDCQNFTHSRCEVWSYNWVKSRCRISGLPDPARDLTTYGGYNALMANHQCRSRQQHQSTLILVNDTLHEVSRVCKYSEVQPPAAQHLYRSCPGVADSLLSDVIPLTTSLEGYAMALRGRMENANKANESVKLNLESIGEEEAALTSEEERGQLRRAQRSIPVTALMATLKPSLSSFLHLGQAHLSAGIGKVFLGAALPMGNLLLLTTNILTMIVTMAAGMPSVTHYDVSAQLKEAKSESYQDWALVSTPDLHTLTATNDVCNAEDLLTSDSIPSLLRGMHEALNRLQGPLRRIIEDANPISDQVRNHIDKQGREYGFWSSYLEDQQVVMRYFAYKVTGGPETSVRQVAVLAGNSLSPVIQGTVIAGGARRPGTATPSWSCIGFVKEKGDADMPWIPRECYQSPILSNSEVYMTNFLPDAQLIRVWGQHSLGHSCPKNPPGIIRARGLLVFVVGRECQLTFDGVHLRNEDVTAESPWARPVVLVDRADEYPMPMIEGALYPKQLTHAIERLTNRSLHPALEGVNESQARAKTDQVLGAALFMVAILMMVIMVACYKRAAIWGWIVRSEGEETRKGTICYTWNKRREEPNTEAIEIDEQ